MGRIIVQDNGSSCYETGTKMIKGKPPGIILGDAIVTFFEITRDEYPTAFSQDNETIKRYIILISLPKSAYNVTEEEFLEWTNSFKMDGEGDEF